MKANHKKSNMLLCAAGIFLVVSLLITVIFGSVAIEASAVSSPLRPRVTYSSFTMVHDF
ncbi:MAG: hypothetical protein WC136_08530 [Sphaerochaeta sp.]|nr:hypothetical protein [Sphaerochaeta sp.]